MSAPFGAIAGTPRRTGQPVRRNSYNEGEREHRIWRPLGQTTKEAWRFKDALARAAKRIDDDTKGAGARMGVIGLTGRKVLEALCEIVNHATGRLDPSIATIAARARLAKGTVVRALARLKDAGFLDWFRRTRPTDNEGQAGPQVEQVTNAYWFALRGRAAGLVRLWTKKKPPGAPTGAELQEEAAAGRETRRQAMRAPVRISAADVLTDEAKAALGRLRSLRSSAVSIKGQNPGSQGQK
jgi:hypothetical protein